LEYQDRRKSQLSLWPYPILIDLVNLRINLWVRTAIVNPDAVTDQWAAAAKSITVQFDSPWRTTNIRRVVAPCYILSLCESSNLYDSVTVSSNIVVRMAVLRNVNSCIKHIYRYNVNLSFALWISSTQVIVIKTLYVFWVIAYDQSSKQLMTWNQLKILLSLSLSLSLFMHPYRHIYNFN
jgi:hypothetical protein